MTRNRTPPFRSIRARDPQEHPVTTTAVGPATATMTKQDVSTNTTEDLIASVTQSTPAVASFRPVANTPSALYTNRDIYSALKLPHGKITFNASGMIVDSESPQDKDSRMKKELYRKNPKQSKESTHLGTYRQIIF